MTLLMLMYLGISVISKLRFDEVISKQFGISRYQYLVVKTKQSSLVKIHSSKNRTRKLHDIDQECQTYGQLAIGLIQTCGHCKY